MVRRRYSAAQWAEWIEEQENSGRTIAGFCESIGVSENSFYVWRRKLQSGAVKGVRPATGRASGFVPLAITDGLSSGEVVEIELPCGVIVRVPGDESLLRPVFALLLQSGGDAAGAGSC